MTEAQPTAPQGDIAPPQSDGGLSIADGMEPCRPLADISSPEGFWGEAEALGLALAAQLEYFESLGVDGLPAEMFSAKLPLPATAPKPPPPTPAAPPGRAAAAQGTPSRSRPSRAAAGPADWAPAAADLGDLNRSLADCPGCGLAETRPAPPRPGQGGAKPLLVVVGPQPSIFDGENWALLTAMLEKGLELKADDYYVTSLIKCSPENEMPPPAGADAACEAMWRKELDLLEPKLVLALGRTTGARLTGLSAEPLLMLRGRSHRLGGAWLRVTYDLEDIRQDMNIKKAAWEDLKRVKQGLAKLKRG